jgi:hypothetical protein
MSQTTTLRAVPLAEYAHQEGLSWAQAWRRLLKREIEGEKRSGRWYVLVDRNGGMTPPPRAA